jgi:hypothetical protein
MFCLNAHAKSEGEVFSARFSNGFWRLFCLSEGEESRLNSTIGRGGGDRTHDLRLKRPLLYH